MTQFDLADLNRFVLAKHHLARRTNADDLVQVVRDVAGLHATSSTTPYLSLLARVRGFKKAQLDEAIHSSRLLARIRCVRKTIYIHDTESLPAGFGATAPMVIKASRRYAAAQGISADDYDAISKRICGLLEGRELPAAAIGAALGAGTSVSAILTLMCDEGLLIRTSPEKGWRDRRLRYALFREWFPGVELGGMSEEKAVVALVRLHVAAFGPVTSEDIVWWTGLGKRKVHRALAALESELAEVRATGDGVSMLMLRSDRLAPVATAAPAEPVVNLLPVLDPYLMGYRERGRYLDAQDRDWVFDRSGNATSTILIDGRVAGVWDLQDATDSGQPLVKLFFFRRLSGDEQDPVRTEAAAVGRFITEREVGIEECDRMVPLTQRTAGSMMSPLRLS